MAGDPPVKLPRNVGYFFDEELCNYNYGGGNPMRPHRHRLTTNLVRGYGMDDKLHVIRPAARTREEIMQFHADGERRGGGSSRGGRRERRQQSADAPPPPASVAACLHATAGHVFVFRASCVSPRAAH